MCRKGKERLLHINWYTLTGKPKEMNASSGTILDWVTVFYQILKLVEDKSSMVYFSTKMKHLITKSSENFPRTG